MVLSRKILLLCLLAFAVAALFAACGDDDDDAQPTATATAVGSPTASGAPIDFFAAPELSDGKLTVGSDIAYAPIEYYEEERTPSAWD